MRIALCSPYETSDVSGIATFIRILSSALGERHHSVVLHTADSLPGISGVPTGFRNLLLTARTLTALLSGRSWTAVHANQPHLQSVAALIAARILGVSYVVTYHSELPAASGLLPGLSQSLSHRILRRFARNLVFVSQATRDQLGRAENPVIYIGIDSTTADAVRNEVLADTDSRFTFAFSGRQTESKGFFELLDVVQGMALDGVTPFRLVLIGDSPVEEQSKRSLRLAGLDGVNDLGRIENLRDRLSVLARSDAVVLPSHREGLPLALGEAMAVGCVPIATNVGGVKELVRSGVTGLVIPAGDESALRDAMLWALAHRLDLKAMGNRAASDVRVRFSIREMVEAYLRLYAQGLPAGATS